MSELAIVPEAPRRPPTPGLLHPSFGLPHRTLLVGTLRGGTRSKPTPSKSSGVNPSNTDSEHRVIC